jgi:hypothetical protein
MDETLRRAGVAATVGGVVFAIAAVVQFRFELFDWDRGAFYAVHQVVALAAVALFVVALWGLGRARVAGDGRYARIVLGLFTAGWLVILIGGGANLVSGGTGPLADVGLILPAIGGGLNTITGLLVGIAVARAGRLPGWRRWSLLVYALYYLVVLSLPIMISGQEPTMITEVGWGICWVIVGVAALTAPGARAALDAPSGLARSTPVT